MVEYASTRLMSSWAHATVAAKSAVITPTTATRVSTPGVSSRMGLTRTRRYTPAVTMVAAWMRADTGVGPSMASGSHTNSGSWADLPQAPRKSRRPMATSVEWGARWTPAKILKYVSEWKVAKARNMASRNPTSPTRLVTNAFLPATAAVSRSNQKEMRKYEQTPTPSHPRNVKSRLSAITSTSIENAKRLR